MTRLEKFSLFECKLTLKDLIKFIHHLDSLKTFALYTCQVFGSPINMKINTKTRFELETLGFYGSSIECSLYELAKLLHQNDSLKLRLRVRLYSKDYKKSEVIYLKDL